MRVSWFMAICLAWMSAVTFLADLHATTVLLPGEDVNAEQAANEARVVSRGTVAV